MNLSDLAPNLVSILPSDWDAVVVSLFVRKCIVNEKEALSKEFQCKCISKSTTNIINLVKYYEENYEVEDIMFAFVNYLFSEYKKNTSDNLLIFKLNSDGNYEIKKLNGINNDVNNDFITAIVEKCLKEKQIMDIEYVNEKIKSNSYDDVLAFKSEVNFVIKKQ